MKHEHVTFSCDRCKADLGTKQPKRDQGAYVTGTFNWREGPGPAFVWTDLCDACDKEVKAFFLGITGQPLPDERREARAFIKAMLAWKNDERADYLFVRMLRMMGKKVEDGNAVLGS